MNKNEYSNLNMETKKKIVKTKENYIVQDNKLYTLDGEYIGDTYQHQISMIYSENQKEKYKNINVMAKHEEENGGFVFVFYRLMQNMLDQLPNLTKPDVARLLYLFTYVQFDTNKIVYDNGRDIPDKDLAKLLKLKDRQYKEYINRLIVNGYIIVNGGDKYIHPTLCKFGKLNIKQLKEDDISYTRLFKGSVRFIFENANVRELNKISIIYLILPYMSISASVLCHNPSETVIEKVKPMTLSELATILNYKDITSLKKQLQSIKISDKHVFGFFHVADDTRKNKVVMNPKVVYSGDIEHLMPIMILF